MSDHFPFCLTRRTSQLSFGRHNTISYRSLKRFDEHAFVNDLLSKELDKCETFIDPNVALEYIYQQINNAISKHASLRCKRVNGSMMILNKLLNVVIIFITFKIFQNIEHRDIKWLI